MHTIINIYFSTFSEKNLPKEKTDFSLMYRGQFYCAMRIGEYIYPTSPDGTILQTLGRWQDKDFLWADQYHTV